MFHTDAPAPAQTTYQCSECDEAYTSLFRLGIHLSQHQTYRVAGNLIPVVSSNKHQKCGICGYFADGVHDFDLHLTQHCYENAFVCGHCGHDFGSRDLLRLHNISEHPGRQLRFIDRESLYKNQLGMSTDHMVPLRPKICIPKLTSLEIEQYSGCDNDNYTNDHLTEDLDESPQMKRFKFKRILEISSDSSEDEDIQDQICQNLKKKKNQKFKKMKYIDSSSDED